jgi:5'(3')-deoxyribonucleotidase
MAFLELLRSSDRKRVGLDVDGTLAMFHEAFVAEYNAANGTHFTTEAFQSYGKGKWSIPITYPELLATYDKIWRQRWESIRPSVRQSTLKLLVEAHDVDILTYRPPGHEECLRNWLRFYFPRLGPKLNIKITKNAEEKVHTDYDILIDDAPPVAEELIRVGAGSRKLILVEQPWNRNERYEQHSPAITRVKTLKEGIEMLVRTTQGTGKQEQHRSRIAR